MTLHWSEAGTYMCSPVLVPQMVGTVVCPGEDTPKVSTAQVPPRDGHARGAGRILVSPNV